MPFVTFTHARTQQLIKMRADQNWFHFYSANDKLVPKRMWTQSVGGDNNIIAGRLRILIATTEEEQRFAEKRGIQGALNHGLALLNPFCMHGKETTKDSGPYSFCVEWMRKGPLGPHLKVNQQRWIDGSKTSATKFGNSTVLPYIIRWDTRFLVELGLPIPHTYTRLLEASQRQKDAGQCLSYPCSALVSL